MLSLPRANTLLLAVRAFAGAPGRQGCGMPGRQDCGMPGRQDCGMPLVLLNDIASDLLQRVARDNGSIENDGLQGRLTLITAVVPAFSPGR